MRSSPLGIIAGEGHLPRDVASSVLANGRDVFILRIESLANDGLREFPGADISMGSVGLGYQLLREHGCQEIVFVGYITRPDLARISFDHIGRALLPDILTAASKGDDAIMGVFIAAFQAEGFSVLGAEEAYRDLLCEAGVLTQIEPDDQARTDLVKAVHLAGVLGAHDIGQGVVVCKGLVLAVEAQEGTDGVLARISTLDSSLRGTEDAPAGVLVKRAKPGQERRVDLPAIGPRTIAAVKSAGLKGIGLEAGGSLIIDRAATLAAANMAGLFIIGIPPKEMV